MLILVIGVGLNIKNTVNMHCYISDSVKSQTIAISLAARELLDVEAFMQYTNMSPVADFSYQVTLHKLRRLAMRIGANNIHCIRQTGDESVLVFDTSSELTAFMPFNISNIHEKALEGHNAAGIKSDSNGNGAVNIGSVPITHNGQVTGAISRGIDDRYIESSYNTALWNSVLLIGILLLTLSVMLYLAIQLLKSVRSMQDKLERQALYDTVTGLPNRQYLWDHLAKVAATSDTDSFALYFIDLDNFKAVNDNAGHDAGDELLKQVPNIWRVPHEMPNLFVHQQEC